MTRTRWNYIKSLAPSSVLAFKSCDVAMLPHPGNPLGPRIVPWTQKPGNTFNAGRNAAKREARDGRNPKHCRPIPRHRFSAA